MYSDFAKISSTNKNARPGGDTEDKTFGKPFPNGRFYLLVFEINHLRTEDINGETAVRFLGENLRAAKVIGSRYAALGLRGSDSVGIVGKSRLFFLRSRVLPLPLLRYQHLQFNGNTLSICLSN